MKNRMNKLERTELVNSGDWVAWKEILSVISNQGACLGERSTCGSRASSSAEHLAADEQISAALSHTSSWHNSNNTSNQGDRIYAPG